MSRLLVVDDDPLIRSECREWDALPVAGVIPAPFDPGRLPDQVRSLLGW